MVVKPISAQCTTLDNQFLITWHRESSHSAWITATQSALACQR